MKEDGVKICLICLICWESYYFVSTEYITKFYQDESEVDTRAVRIRMEVVW